MRLAVTEPVVLGCLAGLLTQMLVLDAAVRGVAEVPVVVSRVPGALGRMVPRPVTEFFTSRGCDNG